MLLKCGRNPRQGKVCLTPAGLKKSLIGIKQEEFRYGQLVTDFRAESALMGMAGDASCGKSAGKAFDGGRGGLIMTDEDVVVAGQRLRS